MADPTHTPLADASMVARLTVGEMDEVVSNIYGDYDGNGLSKDIARIVAARVTANRADERDQRRVEQSRLIPGHLWDPVGRMCECGTETGVKCDRETVEEHLLAAARTDERERIAGALAVTLGRHRPTWQKRCAECDIAVPPAGCPTWIEVNAALAQPADTEGA